MARRSFMLRLLANAAAIGVPQALNEQASRMGKRH